MKNAHVKRFLIVLVASGAIARAQGTFQNWNFELANPGTLTQPPFGPPFALNVPVANLLPYWSVYYGNVQQTLINYNAPSLGSTAVSVVGTADGAIDGNYSALLQGGGTATSASITQTGLIPAFAEALFFEVGESSSGPFTVSIGSQNIPFSAVGAGANYTLYGADISAWADQTEQLTFSSLEGENNVLLLDDIHGQFTKRF